MSETRYCHDCKECRPAEEFYRYPDGRYFPYCRTHQRQRNNEYQKRKPEAHRKASRKYMRQKRKVDIMANGG